eukprot:12957-Heterococcus_DN1.PRE.2
MHTMVTAISYHASDTYLKQLPYDVLDSRCAESIVQIQQPSQIMICILQHQRNDLSCDLVPSSIYLQFITEAPSQREQACSDSSGSSEGRSR